MLALKGLPEAGEVGWVLLNLKANSVSHIILLHPLLHVSQHVHVPKVSLGSCDPGYLLSERLHEGMVGRSLPAVFGC